MNRRTFSSLLLAPLLALLAACARKPAADPPAPATYRVLLQTTKGDVVILVHRDWSPIGADHFYRLVKAGFYNDNAFFRALPNFVVQWGINGNPKINQQWSAISIKDDPPKVSNKIGTVVFAKTGEPDSRTTQVFINLRDNSASLDPQGFTPFGEIVQGMENIEQIYMGYGDGPPHGQGPDQEAISQNGNAYLRQNYPKLDYIKSATIIP
jgi:peptidyl-prolyl cis-trans isomerase A (cyclophilin A)